MNQVSKASLPITDYRFLKEIILYTSFFGLLLVITGSIDYNRSMSNNCVSKRGKEELVKLALDWEKQYATPPTKEQIEELVATYVDENALSSERVVLSWETLK